MRQQVAVGVGALSKIRLGELESKTEVTAKNILANTPEGGRVYVAQLYISVFCEMLNDSKELSDKEKFERFDKVSVRVLALLNPAVPSPKATSVAEPADRRATPARRPLAPAATCTAEKAEAEQVRQELGRCNDLAKAPPGAPGIHIFTVWDNYTIDECKRKYAAALRRLSTSPDPYQGTNDVSLNYGSYKIYVVCQERLSILSVAGPSGGTAENISRLVNSYYSN